VDETIDIADESCKVQMRVQRLCPKRRLETGHQQCGANSFSRYITDRDPPTAARQREKIIVIATDTVSRLVKGLTGEAGNGEALWREKGLLNVFGALQIFAKSAVHS